MLADPATFVRYSRGIKALAHAAQEAKIPKHRKVNVEVHWGVSGSGKSHYAYNFVDDFDDIYVLFSKGKPGTWFDGYHGQSVLIIDDMCPMDIPWDLMLRILHDRDWETHR